jgi:hypothetical protein
MAEHRCYHRRRDSAVVDPGGVPCCEYHVDRSGCAVVAAVGMVSLTVQGFGMAQKVAVCPESLLCRFSPG